MKKSCLALVALFFCAGAILGSMPSSPKPRLRPEEKPQPMPALNIEDVSINFSETHQKVGKSPEDSFCLYYKLSVSGTKATLNAKVFDRGLYWSDIPPGIHELTGKADLSSPGRFIYKGKDVMVSIQNNQVVGVKYFGYSFTPGEPLSREQQRQAQQNFMEERRREERAAEVKRLEDKIKRLRKMLRASPYVHEIL